jgi:hypothetical protein
MMNDVGGNDEDMTAEEFDRRFAAGEPVKLRRGARPVSVAVARVRISESTIHAELASDSANMAAARPRPARVQRKGLLITNVSSSA